MTNRSPASFLSALLPVCPVLVCLPLAAQPYQFQFTATVATPSINRVDYSVRVGALEGAAIDTHLQGAGGVFTLCVYHATDALGNDLDRIAVSQFTRVVLSSGAGSFTIPAHSGQTYCVFSLEAPNLAWGLGGPYGVGARLPQIAANASTRCGTLGGAYTDVGSPFQVHGLINSAIIPLPRDLAREVMDNQKALVLRDPASGQTRYLQIAPWTHWLEFHNGRRLLKEVVGYFANSKPGALGEYYEQLELHAVPVAQVGIPEFRLHPDLLRASTISLEATPAVGSGRYVFECDIGRPDEVMVDGPLVKVLRYRGALQPVGAIANPVPALNCPIVNIVVEVYSGESFVNIKPLLSNSRFEGSGHFIFDQIRLLTPGAMMVSHNYAPPGLGRMAYRIQPAGRDALTLVPSVGPGRHNRLRESGSFLWNTGIFAEFGTPTPRVQHVAENLRLYVPQFFGNRSLTVNYFDQMFSRGAGIPDLRYQGMMEDWKTSWQRPSGINNNAQNAFSIYAHRFHLHFDDGPGTVPYPHHCFGPRGGADTGSDESMMPHNGAVVLAYNSNAVAMVEAMETALFMARGCLTRQPIDTLFLADGRTNSLDYMRYLMWDAPAAQRIPEARMFGGIYFFNGGNNTRSEFHPNLDYRQTSAYQRHVAEGVVPYNELLEPHDNQHCQRYTTHVIEALYKLNPCFLGKIYMDGASEMLASLSYYIGESPTRMYTHIPYGTSLIGSLNGPSGGGNGGRSFQPFGLHAEAMFHRPLRVSDVIIGQQMAALVAHIARPSGYMGSLYGQDARHFEAAQEAGLRTQVSQYLSQLLQRTVGVNDFSLAGVDLRWQADVWNSIFGTVAKAYLGSALDAEARAVLNAIDLDQVGAYTDRFDGAFSTVNNGRVHVGLEWVSIGQTRYAVPTSIKNGPNANMSGGPYERWVFGLFADLPNWRAHVLATNRVPAGVRGNSRELILPVSQVGQESVNGAGIQALWAFQQLGL